ncbi:MAG: CBS domain-containing protein [Gemmatimonadota bacterium]
MNRYNGPGPTPVAAGVVEKLGPTFFPDDLAADALKAMAAADIPFVPVIEPQTGSLVGIVLRTAIERACGKAGHDSTVCRVAAHLNSRVLAWSEDQLDRPPHHRRRSSDVLIVVDGAGRPVGYLPSGAIEQ